MDEDELRQNGAISLTMWLGGATKAEATAETEAEAGQVSQCNRTCTVEPRVVVIDE